MVYLVVSAANAWCFATFGGAAIPATLLAAALCFVVSLCTPANTLSEEERLKMVFATRRRGPEEPENG